ncbi:sugar ABC transporter ATP-binding protein [uncultured Sulfitobacter sp.]|jgi:ribose transport system ATP-binding protein|uniref:sugar ABC transporter ATP-binding protein n=1 Tax=uncultured Sulfitobacter sp. TaxID=191468 RepID=UPI0030F911CE
MQQNVKNSAFEPENFGVAPNTLLKMVGIEKSFPGVKALQGVTFSVQRGEVHALVGENGAGKSTLMKILSGAYTSDHGAIWFDGKITAHASPSYMIDRGIAVIYQEFAQAPHLTVAENIFMNRLPKTSGGMVDWARMSSEALRYMERLGFVMDPKAKVSSLSVAQRQMVEIARAISRDAKLIVLDEPSAVLGDQELEKLFSTIKSLQVEGVSFIYISHRLKEVFEICQSVTVLRDGEVMKSDAIGNWTTDTLIQSMVGRPLTDYFPPRNPKFGDEVLRVSNLKREGVLNNLSLSLKAGEILGVCGLAGAGRSELLRSIVGADPHDECEIELHGKTVAINSPRKAIALGLGFAPEDRKTEGLFLDQSVSFNITISRLRDYIKGFKLDLRQERLAVKDYAAKLGVKTPTVDSPVGNLSGGNQQKCVLAKQLNAKCDILLVDEPTRGVDVGAKREIYELLVELTEKNGLAILMVSSELPEVIGMCDRILVMREGEITAELAKADATEEEIMKHATFH